MASNRKTPTPANEPARYRAPKAFAKAKPGKPVKIADPTNATAKRHMGVPTRWNPFR
jgi:hypothetical protein